MCVMGSAVRNLENFTPFILVNHPDPSIDDGFRAESLQATIRVMTRVVGKNPSSYKTYRSNSRS